jgi:hypothetical protein
LNSRIRNLLISLAKKGDSPIPYRRLINQTELGLNLDIKHEKQQIGEILDEISEEEYKNKRPLLSAMVQDKRNGQADRFFKMCERLGMGEWKELKKDEDFRIEQIEKCKIFWGNENNYTKHF